MQSVIQCSFQLTYVDFPALNCGAVLGSRERNKIWVETHKVLVAVPHVVPVRRSISVT